MIDVLMWVSMAVLVAFLAGMLWCLLFASPENVETSKCFCADIGESCDICTPENVETSND